MAETMPYKFLVRMAGKHDFTIMAHDFEIQGDMVVFFSRVNAQERRSIAAFQSKAIVSVLRDGIEVAVGNAPDEDAEEDAELH